MDDIKEEAAVITTATALVVGGVMVMPTYPTIGTGLVNAGVTVASKGILEFVQNGKVTGSFSDYAKTGIAGFAAGSISMSIASYGAAAGVTGVGNSLFASAGDMAANATTQYILTGKVDPKEVIISGATGFICAEGIRQAVKVVSPIKTTNSLQSYSSVQGNTNLVDDYVDDIADNTFINKKATREVQFDSKKVIADDSLFDFDQTDSIGRTNRQRMQQGLAPIGKDGKSINLHHVDQTNDGPIQEILASEHQKNYKLLHKNIGQYKSQINRNEFDKWRSNYWVWRIEN